MRICIMILDIGKGDLIFKKKAGKEFRVILKLLCKYKYDPLSTAGQIRIQV